MGMDIIEMVDGRHFALLKHQIKIVLVYKMCSGNLEWHSMVSAADSYKSNIDKC